MYTCWYFLVGDLRVSFFKDPFVLLCRFFQPDQNITINLMYGNHKEETDRIPNSYNKFCHVYSDYPSNVWQMLNIKVISTTARVVCKTMYINRYEIISNLARED